MRFRFAAVGTAATLTMLGLVACGDDSASSSEPATLTVTASEPSEGKYAFDVPAEVEGGTVELTFKNDGTVGHEFAIVRIADGTTAEQFVQAAFAEDGAPLPDSLLGAPGGGGGTAPGCDERARRSVWKRARTPTSARSVTTTGLRTSRTACSESSP